METFIKVTGRMAKPMGMAYLLIQMAVCMRENGWMISSMDMERNHGTTKKSNTLVNSLTEKKQARAVLNSKVDITRAISKTENSMEKASITFPIPEKFTKVILKKTTWTVRVS